jgi:hypothetical protein
MAPSLRPPCGACHEPVTREPFILSFGPFGGGGYYNPQGPYGPWAGCGCSSLFMILAGILLIMGGCFRQFGW